MKGPRMHPGPALPLLLACLLPSVLAGLMDGVGGLASPPYALEEHPTCVNTFLACSAYCSELQLKALHHQPSQDIDIFAAYWYTVMAALAITTALSMMAASRSQRALLEAQRGFQEREAALLMRCQGIQEQAYLFGQKLSRACSRPSSRQGGGSRGGSRPSSRQAVTSPSGRAPGVFSPSSRLPLPCQGLPLPPAPVLSPPGRAPTPPGPTSQPSANGFSQLVLEASFAKDTGGSSSDQAPAMLAAPGSEGSASKGFPARSASPEAAAAAFAAAGHSPYMPCLPNTAHPLPAAAAALPGLPSPALSQAPHSAGGASATGMGSSACSLPPAPSSPAAAAGQVQQWTATPLGLVPTHSATQPGSSSSVGAGIPAFPTPACTAYQGPDSMLVQQQQQHAPACDQTAGLEADLQAAQAQLNSHAGHAWVTTSRGGGTPAAFSTGGAVDGDMGFTPLQQQQQPPSTPPSDGLFTPGTASTTRSAGTNVHSIAGSCGGSVSRHTSRAPGPSTPGSATSAASGRAGNSSGLRTPSGAKAREMMQAIGYLDNLLAATSSRRKAKEQLVQEMKQQERRHGTPPRPMGTPGASPQAAAGGEGTPAEAVAAVSSPAAASPSASLRSSMV